MNKYCYRIVFNTARGSLMAVAETAVGHCKAAGTTSAQTRAPRSAPSATVLATVRTLTFALWSALGLVAWPAAGHADIISDSNAPANQRPTVLNAANGVPQVNIQTPSAAGVSRNTYSQFDVQQQGAILNNSRTNVQTQLGGWVQGNPWLATGTARVILNEVNSNNPSLLRGYVEVAGNRAQVVIANPAGVTCDGCGFINANRATLTTGTPIINGGSLEGYRVRGGAINVSGGGLDAGGTDYTDLIARSVQVNAGIWANQLKVTAGANQVDADHSRTVAVAGSGAAPAFAIDVAQLGGMYAGKITLVGTEAGVGVRNAGNIGATAGEVIVTAEGRLENAGRIAGSANTTLNTQAGIVNSGTLYSQADTTLLSRGDIANSGIIAAQADTALTANSITSAEHSVLGAGVQSDGSIGSSGALTLNAAQNIASHGKNLSGGDQKFSAASLDLSGSQTSARNVHLQSNAGDINTTGATFAVGQTATLIAAQTLRTDSAKISASQLDIHAIDISNIGGEIAQTGSADLTLNLRGDLNNTEGRIATNSVNFDIKAATLTNVNGKLEHAGDGGLKIDVTALNSARGQINSNGSFNLKATSANFDAGSTTAQQLTIDSRTLSNRSGSLIQSAASATSIRADTLLENSGGIISSNGATTVVAGNLTNRGGTIQASGTATDLNIAATGHIDNGALNGVAGSLAASRDTSLSANSLDNTQSQISAGSALNISTTQALTNAQGVMAANAQVKLSAGRLSNAQGTIGSVTGQTIIAATGGLDNSAGRIEAAQAVNVSTVGLDNTDGIIVGNSLTLDSRMQAFNNTRGKLAASAANNTGTLNIQSGALNNDRGLIQASGALSIDTHGQTLSNTNSGNSGGIFGQSGITLASGDLINRSGIVQTSRSAPSDLIVTAGGNIDNSALNGVAGKLAASGDALIAAISLDNTQGQITAAQALNVGTTQTLNNTQGLLAANADVNVSAGQINNIQGTIGSVQSTVSVTASSGALDNTAGRIEAAKAVNVSSAGLNNTNGVVMGSSLSLDSRLQVLDNFGGKLASTGTYDSGALTVQSGTLTNDSGLIQAYGALSVDTHGQILSNANSGNNGGILGRSTVTLASGNLNNRAGYIGSNGALTTSSAAIDNGQGIVTSVAQLNLNGNALDNQGGQIQALDNIGINVSGVLNNAAGLVRSGKTLGISAGSIANTNTLGNDQGLQAESLSLSAQQINNQSGAMRADNALTVTSGGTLNNSQGLISSANTVTVRDSNLASKTLAASNSGGTLIAGQQLNVDSASLSGDGKLLSQGNLGAKLTQDYTHSGQLQANGTANFETTGMLINQSSLLAGAALNVKAASIDNRSGGQISANQILLQATASQTLTNRGLIDGQDVVIETAALNNLGSGRIYGDHLAVGATTLTNDVENGVAPVIAARSRLDIGAQTVNNLEHALIFSAGDMALAGGLDANKHATGQAAMLNNNSATIEALGNLDLAAAQINNTNQHFSTQVVQVGSTWIQEYQGYGSGNRYAPNQISLPFVRDSFYRLQAPDGEHDKFYRYAYTRSVTETQLLSSDPGRILAAQNIRIDAANLVNDKSQIIAGGGIQVAAGSVNNIDAQGQRISTDAGTAYFHIDHQPKGSNNDWTEVIAYPYNPAPSIQTINISATVYQQNAAPSGSGAQIAALATGTVAQTPSGAGVAKVSPVAVTAAGGLPQLPTAAINNSSAISPITQVAALSGNNASGPATVIRSGALNTSVPNNSLFSTHPNPTSSHLIETDPRFTGYRNWISSDYLLNALSIDPAAIQKRLGDGFYEQRLIREQVAQLTGRRFLEGYANDEVQYQALMANALTYAKMHNLHPGVSLSAEQMAALTSDVVWLVEKDITLANGQTTKALVPQLYVRVQEGDLNGSGALIAGNSVELNLNGDLNNSGTIAGRSVVSLSAENVKNLNGRISGNDTALHARTDLDNLGGIIEGNNSLNAFAVI